MYVYISFAQDGEHKTAHARAYCNDPPEEVEIGRYQLVNLEDVPETKP